MDCLTAIVAVVAGLPLAVHRAASVRVQVVDCRSGTCLPRESRVCVLWCRDRTRRSDNIVDLANPVRFDFIRRVLEN